MNFTSRFGSFYGTDIKGGESYRNFMVRLDTAHRRLPQHGITLPGEVQGWFLLRKFRMEANSRAMVLTSTGGSLKVEDISRAVRAVFPKGQSTKKDKDVYVAEESEGEAGTNKCGLPEQESETNDVLEVKEVVAAQAQEPSDYESADALEVFDNFWSTIFSFSCVGGLASARIGP